MNIIWIIVISIAGLYSILILFYLSGWFRLPEFKQRKDWPGIPVTLIIPVRNEEENIRPLLSGIASQDYPPNQVEVIFIDDHSEDNTSREILSGKGGQDIRIIELHGSENGKKSAIYRGLLECKTDIVLLLDADSVLYDRWIKDMTDHLIHSFSKLVFGPVRYIAQNPWEKMQQLELFSLVGTGAAACGHNNPILCNGTNMICYRKDYLNFLNAEKQVTVSGDDIFFLLWIKKYYPGKVSFLKSPCSIIETAPSPGLGSFLRQRLRWTSKSRYYKDLHIILSAVTVFLMNFLLLFLLCGMIFTKQLREPFIILYSIKIVLDFIFLFYITGFYRARSLLIYYIPLQLVYFIYVNFIAIAGNLLPIHWKGRMNKI